MPMKKSFLRIKAITVFFAVACITCNSDNKSTIIGLNQNIHHDDFEYSVTAFTITPEIVNENDTIVSKGNFYLVHFKVENKALRVAHQWDNSIAYIVDENGIRYENKKEIQKAVDKNQNFGLKDLYYTPHGSTDSTILVFELPADSRKPYLMVKGEILMGDVFDRARFKKIKVKLF